MGLLIVTPFQPRDTLRSPVQVGVPISTTHVSCGAIFGIGLVNGERQWSTIARILATWMTTLPLGLTLGWVLYSLLT